jgi:hypothetical protein
MEYPFTFFHSFLTFTNILIERNEMSAIIFFVDIDVTTQQAPRNIFI